MSLIDKKHSNVESISSIECFNKLFQISNSYLIDVRTRHEWEFVGVPDLSSLNKTTLFISWHKYPEMNINNSFEAQVVATNIKKHETIFLICRSGTRSFYAANHLLSCGYKRSFNVSDGFEGDKDNLNQRSNINGWKYNNLPWKQ